MADRNRLQKHIVYGRLVLLSAAQLDVATVARRTEVSRPIHRYITQHNDVSPSSVWTKTGDQITAKLNRLAASLH